MSNTEYIAVTYMSFRGMYWSARGQEHLKKKGIDAMFSRWGWKGRKVSDSSLRSASVNNNMCARDEVTIVFASRKVG